MSTKDVEVFVGPCSKFVAGQGWTTEIPVKQIEAKGYHKETQLPTKCWFVDWCLGWGMREYKVTLVIYDCSLKKILSVHCERPHDARIFHSDDLDTNVFFNEQDALAYLKKKELEGSDGF